MRDTVSVVSESQDLANLVEGFPIRLRDAHSAARPSIPKRILINLKAKCKLVLLTPDRCAW
jgi:hypothetical protein